MITDDPAPDGSRADVADAVAPDQDDDPDDDQQDREDPVHRPDHAGAAGPGDDQGVEHGQHRVAEQDPDELAGEHRVLRRSAVRPHRMRA